MFRPNVSMIVFRKNDGKFLLVHKPREHHAWQFPQGGIEPGEDIVSAGKRELREELGTDRFTRFLKSHHVYFYHFPSHAERSDGATGHKQSYLLVEFTGEEKDIVLHQEELDEYRFVYQNEFPSYLESPEYLKKVNQVIYEFKNQF